MRQRGVLGAAALGLMIFLCAGLDTASAQDDPPLFDAIYFPWVPNGDQITDAGPWYGSITVQNIDAEANNLGIRFWVFDERTINQIALERDAEGDPYTLDDALADPDVPRFDLDANASTTLSATTLGLPEPGSAVAVFAVYKDELEPGSDLEPEHPSPVIAGFQKQSAARPMAAATTTDAHRSVDGYSAIPLSDVAWGSQSDFCHGIQDGVDSCDGTGPGVTNGDSAGFDGHSYLPLVQTNSGWNTEIYLSNLDFTGVTAAQVSVTLTESNSQGASASEEYRTTETVNVPPGGTAVLDVESLVGEGWTGSAHITSTVGIGVLAMRSNSAEDMLMLNTSAPSLWQSTGRGVPIDEVSFQQAGESGYRQYAPLVYRDYNGWNTGISFANIADEPSLVTMSFMDSSGSVFATDARQIPAQGQEFIYIPASEDVRAGEGFAGAVIFQAEHPFHVAIDQVKYSTGEAMSYLATASGASLGETADEDGFLSVPLVQKGLLDGRGDVSGIRLFNTSASEPVTFELRFFDSAGAAISPTRVSPIRSALGPRAISTIYTPALSEMSQNQRASAVIEISPESGDGTLVGVSNNVNYGVSGDGATAFNLVNNHGQYRLAEPPAAQE